MAVKIRLRRMGQKKAPFYRIIVADSRSPRDGRFIEEIGTYDPSTDPSTFKINEDLAKKWLQNGAQPTEQVAKLFKEMCIRDRVHPVRESGDYGSVCRCGVYVPQRAVAGIPYGRCV